VYLCEIPVFPHFKKTFKFFCNVLIIRLLTSRNQINQNNYENNNHFSKKHHLQCSPFFNSIAANLFGNYSPNVWKALSKSIYCHTLFTGGDFRFYTKKKVHQTITGVSIIKSINNFKQSTK